MWDTSELVEPALPFGGLPRRAVHPFFSPHLFTGEHLLEIDSLNSAAGVTLTIAGEVLTEGLALIPFVFTHVPNTNRTIATTRVSVPGGWLARLRVSASAGAPIQGQCFVWIRAALGQGGAVLTIGDITSGYLTANTPLAWPGPQPDTPLDGAGAVRSITGSTPAAGGEISETVPTGARWTFLCLHASLTTSAAVANRGPSLIIDDGANILARSVNNVNQTASLTEGWEWWQGFGQQFTDNTTVVHQTMPIGMTLLAGWRIRTITLTIQAADQWTAPQYAIIEHLEGV